MSQCLECYGRISRNVYEFSVDRFGVPLCIDHQTWILEINNFSTFEAIRLYFALKERGVPAQLEKFDGYKHIDIAIPESKVNIEVDGKHHIYNRQQALSDLKRTYYSFLKGYLTIRIPNSLIYDDQTLNETADFIFGILQESLRKVNE